MSFQQQWLLAALPLIAIPLIIHLINQWRFQTIQWAAMMFLLAAQKMSRGYSRLRQWLIMFFRMLAITGLIVAVSRPLSSGWLGMTAGGRPDTTLILFDRSPSMQQRGTGSPDSKLDTGRRQLVSILETLGSSRWVLIDSTKVTPQELETPSSLLSVPMAGPSSSSADLPKLMQAAYDYIKNNQVGRTEIWICSDLRDNDWTIDSGRWTTLRDAFLDFPQAVRIHLLAYSQPAPTNVAVRVTDVRREAIGENVELVLSLRLSRQSQADDENKLTVPLQFDIEGARSVATVELTGPYVDFKDHRIPIEKSRQKGWGRVSIPADANPADDDFYFAFDEPPPRKTVIVVEEEDVQRPLQLATSITSDSSTTCSAEVVASDQLNAVEWEKISLLLWQGPLPSGDAEKLVEAFVDRGGQVVFLPPRNPNSDPFLGVKWKSWVTGTNPVSVESWRSDEDLLSRTQSGTALPVGQLEVRQYCQIEGEMTALATLYGGAPLIGRIPTERGGVYFCTTTASTRDSTLATNGVVLYALLHRAISAGAAVLSHTRQDNAGEPTSMDLVSWNRLAGDSDSLSTEYPYQRGIYSREDQVSAVNRPAAEDTGTALSDDRVAQVFRGLDFVRVDDQVGNASSLIQEVWRFFVLAMLMALVLEAILCFPKLTRIAGARP